MKRNWVMVRSVLLNILLLAVISATLLTGCAAGTTQPGTLEGTVKIGPISPVERPGYNPPVPPEVFEARKIMIYDSQSAKLVKQVDITQIDQSQSGFYQVQLSPGNYTVDIKHAGIDRSSDVPKKIEIKSGETVKVDIDIDTGIR